MQKRSTGERRSGNPDGRGVAPAPAPADVGIVAAMPIEVSDLVDGLTKVWKYKSVAVPVIEGEYEGKIVAVAIAGMGPRPPNARPMCSSPATARVVISAGFAGALNPAYARNDLVLPREVIDREGGCYPVDVPTGLASSVKYATGRLLTVDQVVLRAPGKRRIAPLLPGRSGRHGIVRRGRLLPRPTYAFPVDPRDFRRRPPGSPRGGVRDYQLVGQLSRRSGPAQRSAPAVKYQGFLVPLRAIARGGRSFVEVYQALS